MTEPQWKQELRWMAEAFAATNFRDRPVPPQEIQGVMSRYLMGSLLPHIEAAYQRGLMAGRSQAGYRKNKTGGSVCPTCLSAIGAGESTASAGDP